jgi:hypothetical protein
MISTAFRNLYVYFHVTFTVKSSLYIIKSMAYCEFCRTYIHFDDISYFNSSQTSLGYYDRCNFWDNRHCIFTWKDGDFIILPLKYLTFTQVF